MNDYKTNMTLVVESPDETKGFQVCKLSGEMDKAGLDSIKGELEKLSKTFTLKYLVLDFAKLEYINSESIGFLMALHSHLVKEKKYLVLIDANVHVKDVLSVIGILSILEYFDNLSAFKARMVS